MFDSLDYYLHPVELSYSLFLRPHPHLPGADLKVPAMTYSLTIILVIVGAFLAIQAVCFGFSLVWLWRNLGIVRAKLALEAKPNSTAGTPQSTSQFDWLTWLQAEFGYRGDSGDRGAALRELDRRLGSYPGLVILQRIGPVAPLLGVVVTAVSFLMLNLGPIFASQEANASFTGFLDGLLREIQPLLWGTLAGAALAILNLLLLLILQYWGDRLRNVCLEYYDVLFRKHWRESQSNRIELAIERWGVEMSSATATLRETCGQMNNAQQDVLNSVRALASAGEALEKNTLTLQRAFENIDSSTNGLAPAVKQLTVTAENFSSAANLIDRDVFKRLTETSTRLIDSIAEGDLFLKQLSGLGLRAAEASQNFDSAGSAMRDAALKLRDDIGDGLLASASALDRLIVDSAMQSQNLQMTSIDVADRLSKVADTMEASVQRDLDIAQTTHNLGQAARDQTEELREISAVFAQVVSTLTGTAESSQQMLAHYQQAGKMSQEAARQLQASSETIHSASDLYRGAIQDSFQQAVDSLHQTISTTETSARMMLGELGSLAERWTQTNSELHGSVAGLAQLQSAIVSPLESLNEAVTVGIGHLAESQQIQLDNAGRSAELLQQLNQRLEQSAAAIPKLSELHQRESDLNAEVRKELRRELEDMSQSFERLRNSFGQMQEANEKTLATAQAQVAETARTFETLRMQFNASCAEAAASAQEDRKAIRDGMVEIAAALSLLQQHLNHNGNGANQVNNSHATNGSGWWPFRR
ncbi:hypothetical protein LOC68_01740 [Blastopirellula sp. JC732]|uniref:Uncharacterized protein n=1 Tax=Blastopirellula sediminis TaxID=2894196 RepID=A0A9X1SEV2_9BACT|nr:hypothetical protein [Blastopirellula sediminis]MCC9608090.1 hypothetical protein [Blastopirellula sediminis]MCC9627117.1 hypothetical protein [Blastopirellula sediminis]